MTTRTRNHWLIDESTLHALRAERAQARPSADDRVTYREVYSARMAARESGPPNLSIVGDTAEIRVEGVLVAEEDFWLWFLGYDQTVYGDIQRSLEIALDDQNVTAIRLFVDSPGGTVDGLFETLAALERARASKPISVLAENAFSAAYGIAAAAGPIEAAQASSSFGSVGVAVSYYVWDFVVDVTNTESPDKRPDVRTEEGRAVVRSYLDSLFELFAEAIAKGRGTDVKNVAENFGRGALLIAKDAQELGMINTIAKPRVVPDAAALAATSTPAKRERDVKMTVDDLRSQHPEAYEAAVQEGVKKERKRVCAHLTHAKTFSAPAVAEKAIREGEDSNDPELMAEYMSRRYAADDQAARQADSDAAGDAVEGADVRSTPTSLIDRAAAAFLDEPKGN